MNKGNKEAKWLVGMDNVELSAVKCTPAFAIDHSPPCLFHVNADPNSCSEMSGAPGEPSFLIVRSVLV